MLPCSEVSGLLRQIRNSMESLVQALRRSRAECMEFSILRKKICEKKKLWLMVSGTLQRWAQRRDVENNPLEYVATLDSTSIVEKQASLERRTIASKCHDVGNLTCWNIATLDTNVATFII